MTKHSIGLLALVGLYSGLVSLAAGLRIGEADSALRSSPSDPSAPMVVAESTGKPPLPEMQAVGQFGQPIPDPVGRRQPGQFGGKFGGISVFQFGGQIDVAGTRHLAIEDGPVQVLAMTEAVPTAPASPAFANPKVAHRFRYGLQSRREVRQAGPPLSDDGQTRRPVLLNERPPCENRAVLPILSRRLHQCQLRAGVGIRPARADRAHRLWQRHRVDAHPSRQHPHYGV